jgi:hypothetical protein
MTPLAHDPYELADGPARAPKPATVSVEAGFYVDGDDHLYLVQANRAQTNLYAKKFVRRPSGVGKYVYAPGLMRHADTWSPLTTEKAKELGHRWRCCVVCGRKLSDPQSVEAGIGPVCLQRLRGRRAG